MTDKHELERQLNQLRQNWPSGRSFVDEVMSRVETVSVAVDATRKSGSGSRWRNAAIAVAVLVCIGLSWSFINPFGNTLFAQVQQALKKVNTVHGTMSVKLPDGKLQSVSETWFARGQGFAVIRDDQVRLDDGKYFWEYAPGSQTATRSKSRNADELLDQALDIRAQMKQGWVRFPEGDRRINDVPHDCYRVTMQGTVMPPGVDPKKKRVLIFLTSDSLVRRAEHQDLVNSEWQVKLVHSWEYDVAVDPQVFKPNLGPNVKIMDADQAFEQLADTKTAVHMEERNGLIFAVHQLQRFENGGLLLMTSVRGTEETLRKFPNRRRMMQPGLYVEDGPATTGRISPQGVRCFRISLASASHKGIDAEWWILVPRAAKPTWFVDKNGLSKIMLNVSPRGGYAEHLKSQPGVRNFWEVALPAPQSDPLPTLKQIVARVHADVALLKPVFSKMLDMGVQNRNGVPNGTFAAVEDVTPEQFANAVQKHIDFWELKDIDFQMENGGIINHEGNERKGLSRGVFVGYCKLVNDATIEKMAKHPELTHIDMTATSITDKGLKHLKGLPKLQALSLAETAITDAGLEHLKDLKSLRTLHLAATRTTPAGIQKLKAALPELEVIATPK